MSGGRVGPGFRLRRDDESGERPSATKAPAPCLRVESYSHIILGTGPSLAGPRNIWPFWIVNEVAIAGRPSGPAFARIASGIRARRPSLGFTRPAAPTALINSSYPSTARENPP